jgi:hypothetical protein
MNESNINNDSLKKGNKIFNIKPLYLYRYQNNGINLQVNLFKLNMPQIKSNLKINGKYGIIRTGITDSLSINKTTSPYSLKKLDYGNPRVITNSDFCYSIMWEFNSDSRYGFTIGYSGSFIRILNPDVLIASNLTNHINTILVDGFYSTSSTSKLFFRWHLNKQDNDQRLVYNQIQIGYLVDIFKVNK